MPNCYICNEEKDTSEFHKRKDSKSGYRNDCKACVNARNLKRRGNNIAAYREADRLKIKDRGKIAEKHKLKYLTDPEYKATFLKNCQKSLHRDPDKALARKSVLVAVKSGEIHKPLTCEYCQSSGKIEGHHWSYLPMHWLDVIWLCPTCHGKEHRRLNEIARNKINYTVEE